MMPARPEVWSVGGTGTGLRACTPVDADGTFDATTWVTVVHLPVWPLRRARYRLIERRWRLPATRQLILQKLEPLPMPRAGLLQTWALAWIGLPVGLLSPTALMALPWVALGELKAAAVAAVLSSLGVIPFGVGALVWTLGQPWPRRPPAGTRAALAVELRRTAGTVAAALLITAALLGGSCGGVRVAVDLSQGLPLRSALLGGAEHAAFFVGLCALVGPLLWLQIAWRAVAGGGPPAGRGRA